MLARFLLAASLVTAGLNAATPAFLLGTDYSQWLPNYVVQIATDTSDSIYLLTTPSYSTPSSVIKLAADGTTIVWQNQLTFPVLAMAVDPNGGVYAIPYAPKGVTSVVKLSPAGSGTDWTAPISVAFASTPALAADAAGRVYVAGAELNSDVNADLIRLNSSGTAVDFTPDVSGQPTSIAIDSTGAAYLAGFGGNGIFLAQFGPDGSPGFYSSVSGQESAPSVALDTNGQAVVYASGQLQRYDATTGMLIASQTVSHWLYNLAAFALDSAGNAYIVGSTNFLYPVHNTLAACGSDMLSVIARDGSVLQTTYIPGGSILSGFALLTLGANSSVLIADVAGTFTPSRPGPYPAESKQFLLNLTPDSTAATLPLACAGNAATYETGAIAPGEIVTFFGNGLGSAQGVQTQASLQQPFPTTAANVTVTFDGKPVPLLWVQDGQINAIAPWSLTPGGSTQICMTHQTAASNCLTEGIVQVSPGVFMADGSYAAALNQDGTINSATNPALVGSIVSIFVTGLGPITPAQPDGTLVGTPLPSNVLSATVVTPALLGGNGLQPPIPLNVTYAGPAPDLVAGASQINFQVTPGVLFVNVSSTVSLEFLIHIAGASE